MSVVDDRIVNMQFNNKQFTQGASEAQRSLEGLEKTLVSAGKSRGISTLGNSVDGVKAKFSALQIAGVAALATVASKATAAGLNLIKSFTLGPVIDGFHEYQTNLNSIQTIMANTGAKVGVVNKYLNQLNHYSDKTVYNFSQMADSIGKFTSAGVDLKTSTAAIKGMANVAALSGSNTQQLNTAMYQMSQALASGTIRLQDWNSLVNAGMGGKNLQNALKMTAASMGTNVDAMIKKYGSFRESLTQGGWLTSKVFTQTMDAFTGDMSVKALLAKGYTKQQAAAMHSLEMRAMHAAQDVKTFPQLIDTTREALGSMWSQAFQDILGNFDQSKHLWTKVSGVVNGSINGMSKSLHRTLKEWATEGGRTDVIKGFKRIFKGLAAVIGTVKDAFRDVFPPTMGSSLASFSEGFKKFAKNLMPSAHTLEDLRSIFGGIFAVLHLGLSVVKGVASAFTAFFGALFKSSGNARGGILDIFAAVGQVLMAFDKWVTAGGKLSDTLANMGKIAGEFLAPFVAGIGSVVKAFGLLAKGDLGGLNSPFDKAGQAVSDLVSKIPSISGVIDKVEKKVSSFKLSDITLGSIKNLAGQAKNAAVDIVRGLVEGLKDASVGGIKAAIENVARSIIDFFESALGIHSPAKEMMPIGKNVVLGVAEGIKDSAQFIGKAIAGIGKFIKSAFDQLFGGYDSLDWASVLNALFAGSLILTMRNFVKVMQDSFGGIGTSIKDVFGQLTNTLKSMQTQIKAKAIEAIAIAVGILAASVLVLSLIKMKPLAQSLGAIGVMLGLLVGSLAVLSKIQGQFDMVIFAGALLLISVALLNLAAATLMLGKQNMGTLAKGLGSLAIGLGILVGAIFAFSKMKGSITGFASSLLIMSIALNALAAAVLAFGNMDLKTLAKGLGSMAIGLGILLGAVLAFSKFNQKSINGFAASILIMSSAMVILAAAVAAFGNMDAGTLAKGFVAIAAGVAIMTASLLILSGNSEGVIAAAGAMVLMATAMNLLVGAVAILGNMDWDTILKGIIALTLLAVPILAVGAAAEAVGPGLTTLGIAVGLMGAAMLAAGTGMALFGAGFAVLAATGTAGIAVLVAAFQAFMALLPSIAVQVAAAFVAFLQTIAGAAPKVRTAMDTIFQNLLGVITDNIPAIGRLFTKLIDTALDIVGDKKTIKKMVNAGVNLLGGLLYGIDQNMNTLITKGTKIVVDFVRGIGNSSSDIVDAGADAIIKFVRGLGKNGAKIADAAGKTILKFLKALDSSINTYEPQIIETGGKIAFDMVNGLTAGLLGRGMGLVKDAISKLAGSMPKWMKKILGIHSPSRVMKEIGANTVQGLAIGVSSHARTAVDAMKSVGDQLVKAGSDAVDRMGRIAARAGKNSSKAAKKNQKAAAKSQYAAYVQANIAADKAQAKAEKSKKKAEGKKATKSQKGRAKKDAAAAKAASQNAAKIGSKLVTAPSEYIAPTGPITDKLTIANDQNLISNAVLIGDTSGLSDAQKQLGDDQATAGADLAAKAQAALAKSQKESAKAAKLNGKAAKKMRAQAAADAKQAAALSAQANSQYAGATASYKASIDTQLAALQTQRQAYQANADWQAKFDASDAATQADMLNTRAASEQANSDKLNAEANQLIAKAQAEAATNAAQAQADVDAATQAANDAQAAADSARQDKQQAQDLVNQAVTSVAASTSIQPSKSILEDAASAVDRYSASLAFAEEAAQSAPSTIQYVQNNNSPRALSPLEIYRQTKNLLSAQEIKMGAN